MVVWNDLFKTQTASSSLGVQTAIGFYTLLFWRRLQSWVVFLLVVDSEASSSVFKAKLVEFEVETLNSDCSSLPDFDLDKPPEFNLLNSSLTLSFYLSDYGLRATAPCHSLNNKQEFKKACRKSAAAAASPQALYLVELN